MRFRLQTRALLTIAFAILLTVKRVVSAPSAPPWENACGDGRVDVIHHQFDTLWTPVKADASIADPVFQTVPGCNGNAMSMTYDLRNIAPAGSANAGQSWIVAVSEEFSPRLNVSGYTHIRLAMKGSDINSHEIVEVKLRDDAGHLHAVALKSMTDLPEWRVIYIDLRELTGDGTLDVAHIKEFQVGITRCNQCEVFDIPGVPQPADVHLATLFLDEFAFVNLKPGGVHRVVETGFEQVQPNPAVRAKAAAALLAHVTSSGPGADLIPAWFPEANPNFNTYGIDEALLVFTYEYEITGNVAYRNAAISMAAKLISLQISTGRHAGAWYTAHTIEHTPGGDRLRPPDRSLPKDGGVRCDGNETMTPDEKGQLVASNIDTCEWVGNVGWTLIALGKLQRSGFYPDPVTLKDALDRGGSWIARQSAERGNTTTFPGLISLGTEGNVSAYFGLLAAGRRSDAAVLADAIFTFAWDPIQRRIKTGVGPVDVATAIDVSGTWGVTLLRSRRLVQEALDSQGYSASVMRTCSFDCSSAGAVRGYGDIAGPFTPAVEFTGQAIAAGIKDAAFVLQQTLPLQKTSGPYDGTFPGAPDHWYGGALEPWATTMTGVSPTAWMYFALNTDPLLEIMRQTMSVDRLALQFAAVSTGSTFTTQTPAQSIRLTQQGSGTVTWTATSDRPWLTVTPSSGAGSSTVSIAVRFDASLPASGTAAGSIRFTLSGASNQLDPVPIGLTVLPSTQGSSPPFGSFDTPAGGGTVLAGSVAVTGWTLDNIGVKQVELWRDLQPGETTPPFAGAATDPRNGKVFISNVTFVDSARPDVEGLYPTTPVNYRAGWGYLMLTWGLFGQGNGTYKLYVFGVDQEGNTATIGTKTIVVSNNTATKPFGSIDTPAIGGDPGTSPNFGWGLTPKVNGAATCKIQSNGVQMSIDSGPLQPVVYGDARSDIAGAFPGFANTAAAGGHVIFDWSTLTNGAHTIGWLITDDCNRADGVGSRFFTVTSGVNALTTSPAEFRLKADSTAFGSVASALRRNEDAVLLTRGYGELPEILTAGDSGTPTIDVKQGERIELRLPRGIDLAYQLGPLAQPRPLPIGSTWDAASGIFAWQPAPGFLGGYRLVFSNGRERLSVRVFVTP